MNRGLNTDEVAEPNAFAAVAAAAAFSKGEEWLDELRAYVYENKKYVSEFLKNELPQVKLVPSDATYLLWLDCRGLHVGSDELCDAIRQKTGLMLSSGCTYGESGDGFLRMNVACQRKRVIDGCERLKRGILG